jgi:hypothetical protein
MFAIQQLSVGHWNAWFLVREHYDDEVGIFLSGLWHCVYELTRSDRHPRREPPPTSTGSPIVLR